MGQRTLFTIGHSTRTWAGFVALLKAWKIEELVDVRTVPQSRAFPWFSKERMEKSLPKFAFGYVYLPKLGGFRHPRKDSVNTGWQNLRFRAYADYMQTEEFEEGLKELNQRRKKRWVCVMCSEAVWWRCHRRMIADAEVARGIPVKHVMSAKVAKSHVLTEFAVVEKRKGQTPVIKYPSKVYSMSRNTFFLVPLPPFRLDLTVWTLRRRPDNAIDRWNGQTYRRVLPLSSGPVDVSVTQIGPHEAPKLCVAVEGQPLRAPVKAAVSSALHRLLGLNLDLGPFYRFAAREPLIRGLAQRFRGMKPPRFTSVFEGVINAIACQQLTLTVGIRLLNSLATACGATVCEGTATAHAFPRPGDLAIVSPSLLRKLSFSQQKGRAMIELARSITEGTLDLEELEALPDDEALARLQCLRGVGRWTAEYVLLRGLGRVHVFPGDDVGARNNLQKWLGLQERLDFDGVRRVLGPWRRFGGMIYFHLLLGRLEGTGCIQAERRPWSESAHAARSDAKVTSSPQTAHAALKGKRALPTDGGISRDSPETHI